MSVTKLFEISGMYGSQDTPCTVFVAKMSNGGCWYAIEDSLNVHFVYDEPQDGESVEGLQDVDFFTAGKPINSLDELERQIEL